MREPKNIKPANADNWRDYVRAPQDIYRASFATIEAEADLSKFDEVERQVAIRVIHACGMTDIVDDLWFSGAAAQKAISALREGAPIISDVRMVEHGIIADFIPASNPRHVAIAQPDCADLAQTIDSTKTAGGIEALKQQLNGAIVVIGNAPTALFRILELAEDLSIVPACVIGMPVGFVGAAESKYALAQSNLDHILISGRRGGSAVAAAALNALAKLASE